MSKTKDKVREITSTGKEAIDAYRSRQSFYSCRLRTKLGIGTLAAGIAVGSAVIAFICLRKAKRAYHDHVAWQKSDRALDDFLAESMDASDPVAKY